MNAVQVYRPSTSARNLSLSDKLLHDLASIADDGLWSDIEVKVQDKLFCCHRNILAARSAYFRERLENYRHLTEIVEENGYADAFELVRRYMYTGIAAIDEADEELIANVLSLSIKYKLDELTTFVSGQMRERITIANAVTVFGLMSDVKVNSIAEECLQFIQVHGEDCLQSESYIELNLYQLVHLVKNVSLGDKTQLTVIRKWSRRHRDVNAAELFEMLDGESDRYDGQIDGTDEKEYILLTGAKGEMVILDAVTLHRVSTRIEPQMKGGRIAICQGILYVIDTDRGEIKSTPVSGLLKRQFIQWDECAAFQSSANMPGNVAVTGSMVYFADKAHLWKFDTNSKAVTKSCELRGTNIFASLLELNGLVYCFKNNRFQFTDGINGWTEILPTAFGKYPFHCCLTKIRDTLCLVGGERSGPCSSVLCYDTKWKVWSKSNPVNLARSRSATVSLDGRKILVVGGYDGREWMDTIELFDEETKQWTLIDYNFKFAYPQAVIFYA